ncbi:MAG: cytochrome c-type biogenesis protein CcmH [Rhizobiales bacterium]|nr:cytochrome c-type biogenesis protein CcmH [Hyphomicrobiales bacterium]
MKAGRQIALLGMLSASIIAATAAFAVQPDEILSDAALEKRARSLSAELRCVVCQNQSIDDSNAPLAKDLRIVVRERLTAGDSDAEVIDYVVARYGEFVLLRPRLGTHTLVLWLAPPTLFLLGMLAIFWRTREVARGRPASRQVAPLSPEEQQRLTELLKSDRAP